MTPTKFLIGPAATIIGLCFPQALLAQDAAGSMQNSPTREESTADAKAKAKAGAGGETDRADNSEGGPGGGFPAGKNVFDDTWVTLGLGVALTPSYTGSDDYRVFPLPVVQGEVAGIGISPNGPGFALDLIPGRGVNSDYSFGPTVRLRNDRANNIGDPIVALAGELDNAVEVGVKAGTTIRQFGNLLDSVTLSLAASADVAGAHDGILIEPSISYFTPVDFGTVVSFSLNASVVDDNYADYYYSVSAAQSAASGLPEFSADGGLQSVGGSVFIAYDLDRNALNGGLSAVFIGSYSRLLGDAAETPYTAVRGDPNQLFAGVALGYTF